MRFVVLSVVLVAAGGAAGQDWRERVFPGREDVTPGTPEIRRRVDVIEREREVRVPVPFPVDRPVPVFVDRPVDRPVPVFVDRPVAVERPRARREVDVRAGCLGRVREIRIRDGGGGETDVRVGPFGRVRSVSSW